MEISLAELSRRAEAAEALLVECRLCPRACGVNRLRGEKGVCMMGAHPTVASYGPHFGEELPLVGTRGSGTVFFAGCPLRCLFCQNFPVSQERAGSPLDVSGLAAVFLHLQRMGCHNLNLVTPTHFLPPILRALLEAHGLGLRIPVVWNCGGYESLEALRLLDGVVEIYMPDAKYMDDAVGGQLSRVPRYAQVIRDVLREMHRQVGDLEVSPDGLAVRGLLLRHLVLPGDLAGTRALVAFVARDLSTKTYLNIMGQYRPCHRAHEHPLLRRRVTAGEVARARAWAREVGLHRGLEEN